ncbi:MAG: Asp-tRNA(Asn)/Glu-tRNA(Gln) amidotransferase subunit GatA [Bacteroidota bacterium]|nr:Asp-tRNA(Asn)/Glu-tRNA(Gln) amidotransferase subunit GatA [Bacteroidota bacterium]
MADYKQYKENLIKGETTVVQTVQSFLNNANEHKHLNAFIELWGEEALQRAVEIDIEISKGNCGKLAGMVIALKDNICYKGHSVTASSKILFGFESLYSATAVERLLAAGAIIIGRCNSDEFAMGASNETSTYGPVLNAQDNTRVPGGSSGGCAVAVQAGLCHAALGSDTGGSIRQPAAFCGQVGFKPSYGRVSRWGLLAYGSSFDQIGPITTNVYDCALLMEVISGADSKDATASNKNVDEYSKLEKAGNPLKIAYLDTCFNNPGLDDELRTQSFSIFEQLRAKGHTVEAVEFPYLDYLVPAYYVLTTAEASSNLSRYQGLAYGHRTSEKGDLDALFKRSRSEGFGREVQRRIMLGTFVLTSDFYDAYYTKAQRVRRLIQESTDKILADYDFIITPTTPSTAFKFGEKTKDPVAMYLADIFTVQANLSGHPAISLPAGVHSNGMPWGIQLMGTQFGEKKLLSFSQELSKIVSL